MDLLRSLLFVPADRPRFIDKARGLAADAILLDLEDGVAADAKAAARSAARTVIPTLAGPVWVRVNGLESGELDADLDALAGVPGVAGVMLPKVERAEEVREAAGRLSAARDAASSRDASEIRIIAQIESALGVLNTYEIATAHPSVLTVCFGGARGGDLQTDLGADWSIDGPELLYARQHVLLAARAARIEWPLDGVFAAVRDPAGFEADTRLSRRLGYRGRTVIHPDQVALANRLYAPSPAEVAHARAVVAAAAASEAAGVGTVSVDGHLVDIAMVRHARKVIAAAEAVDAAGTDTARRAGSPDTQDGPERPDGSQATTV